MGSHNNFMEYEKSSQPESMSLEEERLPIEEFGKLSLKNKSISTLQSEHYLEGDSVKEE